MVGPTARVAAIMTVLCGLSGGAAAEVIYLTQTRSITATTSFDLNSQTIAAPNFGPFVQNLSLSTQFPTPAGPTGTNEAEAGIDCQLDPNAIRVLGSLTGSGGIGLVMGTPTLITGEAAARVDASFRVDVATPFLLTASPRPTANPGDRFKIKFESETAGDLFLLDETMPPQSVNFGGVLAPGIYSLEFQVELTIDGPETLHNFGMLLTVPAPGSALALVVGLVGARRRR